MFIKKISSLEEIMSHFILLCHQLLEKTPRNGINECLNDPFPRDQINSVVTVARNKLQRVLSKLLTVL